MWKCEKCGVVNASAQCSMCGEMSHVVLPYQHTPAKKKTDIFSLLSFIFGIISFVLAVFFFVTQLI